ncbi:MAG TPA: response regulator [Beijerinckiaceae bacterium]|jgi:CheY-like chemotaxis protein|nr:response regulator receiver protein [Microvirga sp.]HZB37328.1 response regulator [Beijerinckiaceae bacterium]
MARALVVLLVAGEGLMPKITADGLAVYGYDVLTATDGAGAVEQVRSLRRLDVLVIDAELGGSVDGLSAARLAREFNPKLDVIYTARVPHLIPERAKVRGAPCIRAPYHPYQIAAVISALKHRPARDELAEVA